MVANHYNRIFKDSHHTQSEQVYLDYLHIGAVILVPLNDDAAGHRGGLERDDRIEIALTYDHPARVLSEVTWQVLYSKTKLQEFANSWMLQIEPRFSEIARG